MSSFFCLYRICSRQFLEFLLCIQRRSSKYIFQISTGASWPKLVNYLKHVTVLKSRYRDNYLIRPHIHFATHVNLYDWDEVSIYGNTIRYIWFMQTAFKLQQRIAWQSSYNDMRDETSLEHERVFKQLYYHSLPFDQIVYSFLLSLSLFNRKFYQPFSAVPECRNIRCNRKPCNKTQMNHNILLFFSALLM